MRREVKDFRNDKSLNEITVDGDEFARAAHNALVFTPARSCVPAAMLYVTEHELYFLATDTYTIGRPSLGPTRGAKPLHIELTRSDLQNLDKLGRACKGELRIAFPDDRGLIATGVQTQVQEAIPNRAGTLNYDRKIWNLCDDLLRQMERRDPQIPELLALDPALLSRFGRIKTPKGSSPMLDMRITSATEPILIKCGPRFMGVLMPVDRGGAGQSTTRGNEFLW
ncbi:hypothetical protein ACIQU6_34150 [Streptomyces sp. NPDC090442]|uniref:hypothetical protein n=1 Tax=Streptomyces sp. NPDC090442 TaxID=3365962 RepID=UPI0037F6DF2B